MKKAKKAVGSPTKARRDLVIRRRKFAAVLGIALIGIGITAKPAYRRFYDYRARQNLNAAKLATRREDWGEARDKAKNVLMLHETRNVHVDEFDAYRIWTRALGKLGAPSAYMAAAQIFTDRRATRADLLEVLRVMAQQAPHAVTLSAFAVLPPKYRDQAAFRAALVPLLIQRGQLDIAENCLREVAQPTDEPLVRVELVRALCSRPNAGRLAESRRILAGLIAAKADDEALAALRILGETPNGLAPDPSLPDLPEWLAKVPKATPLDHLLAMNPSLAAQPESAQQGYESAIKRYLASDPGVLGNWLVGHGQAEKAASILEEPAKTNSGAYLARLNALLRLHKTDEITAALAAPPDSCDLVAMRIVQANFAASNGDMIGSDVAWTGAMDYAVFDSSRNRFLEIAHAAAAAGAKDAADNAWVAAVRMGWGPLPLYNDLLPVFVSLMAKGRSEDMLAMFRALLRFEPLNPDLQNNAYYFGLLHGLLTGGPVATTMEKLIKRQDKPVFHSTLMLAEMLDGRPADALTCLPKFAHDKTVSPIMSQALEGTARVLNGETDAGTALLRQVDWTSFMRQERAVFRSILVKLKIAERPPPELANPSADDHPEQIPAWRKAVERLEKDRASDVLPSLPEPRIPGASVPDPLLPKPEEGGK